MLQCKPDISIIITLIFFILLTQSTYVIAYDGSMDVGCRDDAVFSHSSLGNETYTGRLRIYIVEKTSRWKMANNQPFHFGFLDFAANETICISYNETFSKTYSWDAAEAGFEDVYENNIMVIAVVFNDEVHQKSIDLPDPWEDAIFDAYYADATAGATSGTSGVNQVTEDFTHTIFCEEVTSGSCSPCVDIAYALETIYYSQDYPFYYVALVWNNDKAIPRISEYFTTRVILLGTCFFDGGHQIVYGSADPEPGLRNAIETGGLRDVHQLHEVVAVEWLGDGRIQIDISITNSEIDTTPVLSIGDITSSYGGIGKGSSVSAEIVNEEPYIAANIDWSISVVGGILGILRICDEGTIDHIGIGEKDMIQTSMPIFGFGRVTIRVVVEGNEKEAYGFVAGPLLFVV